MSAGKSEGAALGARDMNKWTALTYAAMGGNLECVQLLIGWGAARTRNKEGKTADALAEAEGHAEIAEAFAAAPNSPPPPQTRASFRGRLSAGAPAPKSNATMQEERKTPTNCHKRDVLRNKNCRFFFSSNILSVPQQTGGKGKNPNLLAYSPSRPLSGPFFKPPEFRN